MSYCRIGEDSDVYVVSTGGGIEVIVTGGERHEVYKDAKAALKGLEQMQKEGLKVPARATDRLKKQIK